MDEKLLLSVREVVERTGLSRSTVYSLMAGGQLRYVKVGSRRLVPVDALRAFVCSLAGEKGQPA